MQPNPFPVELAMGVCADATFRKNKNNKSYSPNSTGIVSHFEQTPGKKLKLNINKTIIIRFFIHTFKIKKQ